MTHLIRRVIKLARVFQVPLWRKAFLRHRVAASVEHEAVLRSLGPLDLIVDIGANRGQFALLARHYCPVSRIVSFEPLPLPSQTYRRIFTGDHLTTLYQAAIGPEHDNVLIHVSARDDSSSLLSISDLQSQIFPGTGEVGAESVVLTPLDSVLARQGPSSNALLKLDVQGYEYQALQGCQSLLNQFGHIYCECSFVELYTGQRLANDIVDWLSVRGFFLKAIYNLHLDTRGLAIQADVLFERR